MGRRAFDLTELAAEDRMSRLCDALGGSERFDVLLVDDQVDAAAGWFNAHLHGHRRLSVTSIGELKSLLAGSPLPNVPPPPHNPVMALVDLFLGVDGGTGLRVVETIRSNPGTARLPIVLLTNELSRDRDLLAVLCAEANGAPLLLATKSSADGPFVREILEGIGPAVRKGIGVDLTTAAGLQPIHPVRVRSRMTDARHALSDVLLGMDWKPEFWRELGMCRRPSQALGRALDRAGSSRTNANREMMRSDFGELPVALAIFGGRFAALPQGLLDLGAAQGDERYEELSRNRQSLMVAFFGSP